MNGHQMLGADPAELRATADSLRSAGNQFRSIESRLTHHINTAHWFGPDLTDFAHRWNSQLRHELVTASAQMDTAAAEMQRQADQQDAASAAFDLTSVLRSAAEAGWERARGWFDRIRDILDSRTGAQRAFDGELERLRVASRAEQTAWWNALDQATKDDLLANRAEALLMLGGLPAAVRLAAGQTVALAKTEEAVITATSRSAGVDASIPLRYFNVEAGVSAEVGLNELANGKWQVDVNIAGKLGASFGLKDRSGLELDASALANGSTTQTYEFETREEAEDFQRRAIQGLAVSSGERALGAVVPFGRWLAEAVTEDYGDVSDKYRDHLTGNVVEGGLTRDITVGGAGAEVAVNNGAKVAYDANSNRTTVSAAANANAELSFGPFRGGADAAVEVSATFHGTELDSVQLKVNGSVEGGAGVHSGSGEAECTVTIDAQDPEVRATAAQLVRQATSGTLSAADLNAAFVDLYGLSEVTIEGRTAQSTSAESPTPVVSAKVESERSVLQELWFKPRHGDFVSVRPEVRQ